MFHSPVSKSTDSRAALSGGLPTFTPGRVAQSLVPRRETPQQPAPKPKEQRNPPTVTIDLGDVIGGAVQLAKFFVRRVAQRQADERALDDKALELARAFKGLVGVPDLLMHSHCTRAQAEACLARLENRATCRFLCTYQEEALYVFPAQLPRVWSCDYCESQFSLGSDQDSVSYCGCPNCGAKMAPKILY